MKEYDGSIVKKKVMMPFLKDKLQPSFWEWTNKIELNKDWVCFAEDGPKIFDPRSKMKFEFKPFYQYSDPDENSQTLHYLKLLIYIDSEKYYANKNRPIEVKAIKWYFRFQNEDIYHVTR